MMLLSVDFSNLHTILETLYDDMLPLCEDMMDVGKGIAGLGALFYVAMRVWQSLAHAEPVDVYPLLRPFAIGICILLFPTLVLGTMNSVLGLVVQGTHRMLEGQTLDMEQYREQKEKLEYEIKMRNPETAYLVSDEEFDRQIDELGWGLEDTAAKIGMYAEWGAYQFEKIFRDGIRYLLELLFRLRLAADRHGAYLLSDCPLDTGTGRVRLQRVGRFPFHAQPVVHAVHLRLPVASGQ